MPFKSFIFSTFLAPLPKKQFNLALRSLRLCGEKRNAPVSVNFSIGILGQGLNQPDFTRQFVFGKQCGTAFLDRFRRSVAIQRND